MSESGRFCDKTNGGSIGAEGGDSLAGDWSGGRGDDVVLTKSKNGGSWIWLLKRVAGCCSDFISLVVLETVTLLPKLVVTLPSTMLELLSARKPEAERRDCRLVVASCSSLRAGRRTSTSPLIR